MLFEVFVGDGFAGGDADVAAGVETVALGFEFGEGCGAAEAGDILEEFLEEGGGEEIVRLGQDAGGMISGGVVETRGAAGGGGSGGGFEDDAVGGETDFGKAEEDEAENGGGVFLGLEAGVRAELVGGVPEALFEGGRRRGLFRWGRSRS